MSKNTYPSGEVNLRHVQGRRCPYRKSNPDVLLVRSAKERRGNNAANGLDLCTENFRSRRIGGSSPAEFWLPRPPGRDFNIEIARAMKHQAAAAQAEQEWIP